jgi:hypothetical protein
MLRRSCYKLFSIYLMETKNFLARDEAVGGDTLGAE